jgi:hypothetical protein
LTDKLKPKPGLTLCQRELDSSVSVAWAATWRAV